MNDEEVKVDNKASKKASKKESENDFVTREEFDKAIGDLDRFKKMAEASFFHVKGKRAKV